MKQRCAAALAGLAPAVAPVVVFLSVALLAPAAASALEPIQQSFFGGVAIGGADPVAYFTEARYRPGSADFEAEWMEAVWRFASEENRERFLAEPERYAPAYGGYCAYAVAHNYTAKIDPRAWTIAEGRLYLNYSLEVREKWEESRDAFIASADRNWPALLAGD